MSLGGFLQCLVRLGRIQDGIGDLPLALERKTNNFSLLDGAARGFIRRCDDKVCQGAPLDFSGTLQPHHNLNREAGFQTSAG